MRRAGLALIELIGVLAVLVILVALLLPQLSRRKTTATVVASVNEARIAEVLLGVQALKAAATEHCARFGSLASRSGTPFPVSGTYENYDAVLVSEQILERPFAIKLGAGGTVRLVNASGLTASSRVDGTGGAYDLEGRGANSVTGAAGVLEVLVRGVSEGEAKALNDGLDGPALGAREGEDDFRGRVTYRRGPPGEPREVHIYITHR